MSAGVQLNGVDAAVATNGVAPAPAVRESDRKILIVDDNKSYYEVIAHLLNFSGYETLSAYDGEEGLRKAILEKPDLIILDYVMPKMNGFEVLGELARHDETRSIPVIFLTAAPDRLHLKECGFKVAALLKKPVGGGALLETVESVLPKGRSVAENVKAAIEMPDGVPKLEDLETPELEDLGNSSELLMEVHSSEDVLQDSVLEEMANDSPLVNRVNQILVRAVVLGASDIHIEPQEREVTVRIRRNGILEPLCSLPATIAPRLAARVKIMAELKVTERRLPQDGQFRATVEGKKVDFRVSMLPSSYGEKAVLRILVGDKLGGGLDALGLSERDVGCMQRVLRTPHGLILVTGPTGSGKTTTLYSMLNVVNNPGVNIMTVEDPIEYRLPGVTQVSIDYGVGRTFEKVLRAFLRQDPDIMLVGEIRDLETAEIAVKASITGHLVLSTLHTNSAPATITRLTHMGLAPYLVAASLKVVVAQRLFRLLCPDCKIPAPLSKEDRVLLKNYDIRHLKKVYRSVGCRKCNETGFIGRRPIFEVMPIDSAQMRETILAQSSTDAIDAQAVKEGMVPLREAALAKAVSGETSLAEALKIILGD